MSATITILSVKPVLPKTIKDAFDVFGRRGCSVQRHGRGIYIVIDGRKKKMLSRDELIARARDIIQREFDASERDVKESA